MLWAYLVTPCHGTEFVESGAMSLVDEQHRAISKVNKLLAHTTPKIIEAAIILGEKFPRRLPNPKVWNKEWGCIVDHESATALRALGRDPVMTDPENYKHFPPNVAAICDIWKFKRWCERGGKPEIFLRRIHDGTINSGMRRPDLRDLVTLEGYTRDQARRKFQDEAEISSDYDSGGNIFTGEFQTVLTSKLVPDCSVDLIFADLPWEHESVHLHGDLAEFARAKLKTGGLCLVVTGNYWLDDCMALMKPHLTHLANFRLRFEKRRTNPPFHNIHFTGQPVLVYVKGPRKNLLHKTVDEIIERANTDYHKWGRSIDAYEYFIRRLTNPGDLVCDPTVGGGPVPVACYKLGRRFIGAEKSSRMAKTARRRLDEFIRSHT
jgi:hypothetical protein